MKTRLSRRKFLGGAATAGAGLCLSLPSASGQKPAASNAASTGKRGVWPICDRGDEKALLDVLHSGKWGRTAAGESGRVREFEKVFAERMRAKYCIATSSGTTALLSALGALNVGPGDEVILPPYTFVATFNAVTSSFALPIFADVDAESFQIDPVKVAAKVTSATRVLLPVHIGGSPCDLGALAKIARDRKIAMIEDACQAPGAEWEGRTVGTVGLGGCFSFQASKNLTSGEGGAVITNEESFANQVYNFHTPGNAKPGTLWGRASNHRLTEFQAGLLLSQYTRFNDQQDIRNANALHLSNELKRIPGITPASLIGRNSRSAWHLYMFRYDSRQFAGLSRAKFLQALSREGVAASSGYSTLNNSAHVKALAENPHYQRIYGKDTMARWVERNQCPVNDRLVEEAVWLSQRVLLGSRSDMDRIAETISRIRKRAGDLARAG